MIARHDDDEDRPRPGEACPRCGCRDGDEFTRRGVEYKRCRHCGREWKRSRRLGRGVKVTYGWECPDCGEVGRVMNTLREAGQITRRIKCACGRWYKSIEVIE